MYYQIGFKIQIHSFLSFFLSWIFGQKMEVWNSGVKSWTFQQGGGSLTCHIHGDPTSLGWHYQEFRMLNFWSFRQKEKLLYDILIHINLSLLLSQIFYSSFLIENKGETEWLQCFFFFAPSANFTRTSAVSVNFL